MTCNVTHVMKNTKRRYYEFGRRFDNTKWAQVIDTYLAKIKKAGKYLILRLVDVAKVEQITARNALYYFDADIIYPTVSHMCGGRELRQLMRMKNYTFVYSLYLDDPSLQNDGY